VHEASSLEISFVTTTTVFFQPLTHFQQANKLLLKLRARRDPSRHTQVSSRKRRKRKIAKIGVGDGVSARADFFSPLARARCLRPRWPGQLVDGA